jgi:hypothetical protein
MSKLLDEQADGYRLQAAELERQADQATLPQLEAKLRAAAERWAQLANLRRFSSDEAAQRPSDAQGDA